MNLVGELAGLRRPRLLAVRLDNIGDMVMLSPALRAIKECLPQAHLTMLTTSAGAEALPLLTGVDDVMVTRPVWQELQPRQGSPAQDPAGDPAEDDRRLVRELRRRRFHAALIFTSFSQTPHPAAVVCSLAGIPVRAGSSYEKAPSGLLVDVPSPAFGEHQAERNLSLLEGLGFTVRDRSLSVSLPRASAGPLGPYVVVSPWASCPARSYSAQAMLDAAARVAAARGWSLYLVGRERERGPAAGLRRPATTRVVDLVGKTDVGQLAALIAGARLVFCNNTLALHLADATRTPLVVTYAGTDLESQWAPRNSAHRLLRRPTACAPCYLLACPYQHECLQMPPAEVAAQADALLAEMAPPRAARS